MTAIHLCVCVGGGGGGTFLDLENLSFDPYSQILGMKNIQIDKKRIHFEDHGEKLSYMFVKR